MTMIEEKGAERVETVDKNTQSTMSTKQICFLLRQKVKQCIEHIQNSNLVEELTHMYLNHPGFFIMSLIMVASILIPTIIVISIIAIHITIGIIIFIIFEAIIILSSTAVITFIFLFFVATLVMTAISILTIYLSAHWFAKKIKVIRKNFFYDLLKY